MLELSPIFYLFVKLGEVLACAEKKRDTPNSGKRHDGIYYAADERILSAEEPCDDVKLKKSDTSPIERTDYGEHKGNSIHDHGHDFLFYFDLTPPECFPPAVNYIFHLVRKIMPLKF